MKAPFEVKGCIGLKICATKQNEHTEDWDYAVEGYSYLVIIQYDDALRIGLIFTDTMVSVQRMFDAVSVPCAAFDNTGICCAWNEAMRNLPESERFEP